MLYLYRSCSNYRKSSRPPKWSDGLRLPVRPVVAHRLSNAHLPPLPLQELFPQCHPSLGQLICPLIPGLPIMRLNVPDGGWGDCCRLYLLLVLWLELLVWRWFWLLLAALFESAPSSFTDFTVMRAIILLFAPLSMALALSSKSHTPIQVIWLFTVI